MDILVKVPDNKVEFFMELVQNLKFKAEPRVKAKSFTLEQQEWINDLKESLEEVELHNRGKLN